MIDRLVQRGYLPGPLESAFRHVDRRMFVGKRLQPYAGLDVPLPLGAASGGLSSFSMRGAALILLALDVRPGHRVLIDAHDAGYLAALAAELAGPRGEVVLAAGSAPAASVAARRLRAAGYPRERVRAVASAPYEEGPWDRILVAEESSVVPTPARRAVAELGALVVRIPHGGRLEVVRTVRAGDEFAEMMLGDLSPSKRPLGAGVDEPWHLRRLLALEEALRRVWTGEAGSAEEAEFDRAVDETWRPAHPAEPRVDEVARAFFHLGYVYLMAGDLETAEDCYRASIATHPTAEGWTFLGWAWSFSGRYDDAIDACRRGLKEDATFGNAYNDIGAYLIELGRPDEAVGWLERALLAPRYAARAYPYVNLARAKLLVGDEPGARDALEAAIRIDPEYEAAKSLLNHLDGVIEVDEDEDADEYGMA